MTLVVSFLALLLALLALAMHFLPQVQYKIQEFVGPLPIFVVSPMARLVREAPPGVIDVAAIEGEIMQLAGRQDGLETSLAALRQEAAVSAGRTQTAIANLSAPGRLPLLVSRIALRHAAGTLDQGDVEMLANLAGSQPALAEAVAQLKVLALEDVQTFGALRDAYYDRQKLAIVEARRARMTWWELPVSYARAGLSDMGLSQPVALDQDQSILEEVARKLDSGRLDGALRELQAASPELKNELSSWSSAARLRVSLDSAVLQVVDGLLEQLSLSKTGASPG